MATNCVPLLPDSPGDWDSLLGNLHCGIPVEISAENSPLQLRISLEDDDRNTEFLNVALGLYRSHPKTSLSEGAEFFTLGSSRVMCGFNTWTTIHRESGVPLLQRTIVDLYMSVLRNSLADLAGDLEDWKAGLFRVKS